jgi:CDP-diacylglycerol--glycerol-3-phosphate 3-phosphatidyltransferase
MVFANLITLSRLPLLVVVLSFLFYIPSWTGQLLGLALLGVLFFLDWLDGYVARRRRETSELGAVLDIALDRAVENILWVAFMRLDLVPFWVPVVFLVRSFVVDGIRGVAAAQGRPGFSMMHSPWGRFLVASRFMRGLYGLAKGVTFASLWLSHSLSQQDPRYLALLAPLNQALIWLCVVLCVGRGLPVLLDGRLYFPKDFRPSSPKPEEKPW